MNAPAAPGPAGRARLLAPAAIMALAALLRAPFLADGLWYDEITSFLQYSLGGPATALGSYATQTNHPLHSLLCWASTAALGVDEVTVRLPSFLAGLLAVAATGWLGAEAGGRRTGLLAAAAAAVMPTAVLPATEARGYALMMLFAALMTALLLRSRRTGSRAALAAYAACAALGAWSHLVTACVPAFHGAWLAVRALRAPRAAGPSGRRATLAGMAAIAAGAVLAVAAHAPILGQVLAIRSEFRALDGNEPRLLGPEGAAMLLSAGGSWTWWASLAALPLAAAGVAAAREDRALRTALALALGGALVALAFPLLLGSWLYARFLAFTVPGIALLLAAGAAWLLERRPATGRALAAAAVAGWVACLATVGPRQPLREAIDFVAAQRREAEGAFAVGLPEDVHLLYADAAGLEMPGSGPYGRDVDRHLRDPRRRWAVLLYPRALARTERALHEAGFEEAARFPGWIDQGDGTVVVLRRR